MSYPITRGERGGGLSTTLVCVRDIWQHEAAELQISSDDQAHKFTTTTESFGYTCLAINVSVKCNGGFLPEIKAYQAAHDLAPMEETTMQTMSAPVMLQDSGVSILGSSAPMLDMSTQVLPSWHTTS